MTELSVRPHDHIVAFYDEDADIVDRVVRFVGEGLRADDAAIIIVTPDHRIAIDAGLVARGLDLGALRASGRYVPLDALETLASFMSDGLPDPERFHDVVGSVVRAAASAGTGIRAFGEMVALLWSEGNVAGAIELESTWNELAEQERFVLLCGYPLHTVIERDDLDALTRVCTSHSELVGPGSYERFDPSGGGTSRTFLPVISAVTAARTFAEHTLDSLGVSEIAPDATIVVSELASNAVMHADSAFRLTIERDDAVVRITIDDINDAEPSSPERTMETIGGLGLVLVDGLTSRWGTELLPSGKRVWCEFALS